MTADGGRIATARLVLRPARPGDLAALHAVYSDAETMRYWSDEPHRDLARTQATLDALIATPDEFVVEQADEVIGKCGLWRPHELGFILRRDRWGKGLAGEAVAAVTAEIWRRHPDLDRITAETDPLNAASVAVLRRAGFFETGRAKNTFYVGGIWSDSVYFALPRPDAAATGPA